MAFHFYSNYIATDATPLGSACLFSGAWNPDCNEENPGFIQLMPTAVDAESTDDSSAHAQALSTFTTRSVPPRLQSECQTLDPVDQECRNIQRDICKFSGTNPTILFANPKTAREANWRNRSPPALNEFTSLTVISSARTMELYSSGEYVTTLRGTPLYASSTNSSKAVPLYTIHVGKEGLPQRCHSLLFKFFLPTQSRTKPSGTPATPRTLLLHWLAIQGTAQPMTQDLDLPSGANATSSATISECQPLPSQPPVFPNPDPLMSVLPSAQGSGSTIDLEKVREMLGQAQINSLPQGAKELMKVMEMQASMSGGSNGLSDPRLSLFAMGGLTLPRSFPPPSSFLLNPTNDAPTSSSESEAIVSGSSDSRKALTSEREDQSTYVTRKELELMEERIMTAIDQRFKEMEERIVGRILSAKRKSLDQEHIDSC